MVIMKRELLNEKPKENIHTESHNKSNKNEKTETKSMRPKAYSEKVNIYIMLEFGKRK